MSAIPIANGNFAFEDRAAAYIGSTIPDLGLLDAKPKSRAGNQPIQLTPRYPLNDETPASKVETSRLRNAPSAAQKIAALERSMNDAKNSWVIESMMRGLDKYQAGRRLSADVTGRQVSVLR